MKKRFTFEISENEYEEIEFNCEDVNDSGGFPCGSEHDCHEAVLIHNGIIEWWQQLSEYEAKCRCEDYGIVIDYVEV